MPTATKCRTVTPPVELSATLDPAIVAKIPDVDRDPELLRVVSRLHAVKSEMAKIQEALNGPAYYPPSAPGRRVDIDAAAEAVTAGSSLESTASAPRDSDRRDQLLNMKIVGERALPTLQSAVATAQIKAEQAACKVIAPIAAKLEEDTLATFEKLLACLSRQQAFYAACQHKGLQTDHIHSHWIISPFENALLTGGGMRIASLESYVAGRRAAWNLNGRKKVL